MVVPAADVRRLRTLVAGTDPWAAVDAKLPLLPPFEELLGRGLRRGAVVAVDGTIARMSLAMALMAQVSIEGGWCGVVGVPSFGAAAASELGVAPDRLVLVPQPGPEWAEATAALLSGLDAVLVRPPGRISGQLARRLAARARQHRCTVLTLGPVWEGTQVRIAALHQEWRGLRAGSGRLRGRRVRLATSHRPGVELDLWLPGPDGQVRLVDTGAVPAAPPVGARHRRVG